VCHRSPLFFWVQGRCAGHKALLVLSTAKRRMLWIFIYTCADRGLTPLRPNRASIAIMNGYRNIDSKE
jgi:hypothetical protein